MSVDTCGRPVTRETKVEDLVIYVRTMNTLRNGGFLTVADVVDAGERALRNLPNFGRVSFADLKDNTGRHLWHTPEWHAGYAVGRKHGT